MLCSTSRRYPCKKDHHRRRSRSLVAVSGLLCHAVAVIAPGDEIDRRCLSDLTENGPPAWKKVASFVENIGVTCQERRVDHQQEGAKTVSTAINSDWSLCWNRQSATRLLERRDLGSERRQSLYRKSKVPVRSFQPS